MSRDTIRVVLASDQPEVRRYLGKIVEQKLDGVVVGEGENAIKAVWLARRLRPDMAIIDSYLPYTVGLNEIAMSRNAGLDTAQIISAEIPNVRVVLVNNAGVDWAYPVSMNTVFARQPAAENGHDGTQAGTGASVIFASLQNSPLPVERSSFFSKCFVIGTASLILGLLLTATVFLAYAGLPLIFIGGTGIFIGCLGGLVDSLRRDKIKKTASQEDGDFFSAAVKSGGRNVKS